MNDNTCKTCRFWNAHDKSCHKRFADIPNNVREFKSNTIRVQTYPQQGEYVSALFTGPDFGCVHYEKKKTELEELRELEKLVSDFSPVVTGQGPIAEAIRTKLVRCIEAREQP